MDPFFWDSSLSKLIQQTESIVLIVAMVLLVVLVSERLFGLNIKGVVDGLEELLAKARRGEPAGNPWPATVLLICALFSIVWIVRGF